MSTASALLPPDRSSIPATASVTNLVEALHSILDVVDPVTFALPASPDTSLHKLTEKSGTLISPHNSKWRSLLLRGPHYSRGYRLRSLNNH